MCIFSTPPPSKPTVITNTDTTAAEVVANNDNNNGKNKLRLGTAKLQIPLTSTSGGSGLSIPS